MKSLDVDLIEDFYTLQTITFDFDRNATINFGFSYPEIPPPLSPMLYFYGFPRSIRNRLNALINFSGMVWAFLSAAVALFAVIFVLFFKLYQRLAEERLRGGNVDSAWIIFQVLGSVTEPEGVNVRHAFSVR